MNWELGAKQRVDFVAFAGINLSGERTVVEIHPVGGRQGDVTTDYLKSCVVLAPLGTRVVLMTSDDPEDWKRHPWRCVEVKKGSTFVTKEGRTGVRVPDLDWLDAFDAKRTDPELQCSFEEATDIGGSKSWTYGRPGDLKNRVKVIRIEKI